MNNKKVSLDDMGVKWTQNDNNIILEVASASHLPPALLATIQETKGHWTIKNSPTGALYGDLSLAKNDTLNLVYNELNILADSMGVYLFGGGDSIGGYPIGALNIARLMLTNKLHKSLGLPSAKISIHISAFLPCARLAKASRIMDIRNNYSLPAAESITISATLGNEKLEWRTTEFASLNEAATAIRHQLIDSYIPAPTPTKIHYKSLMARGNHARSN